MLHISSCSGLDRPQTAAVFSNSIKYDDRHISIRNTLAIDHLPCCCCRHSSSSFGLEGHFSSSIEERYLVPVQDDAATLPGSRNSWALRAHLSVVNEARPRELKRGILALAPARESIVTSCDIAQVKRDVRMTCESELVMK